MRGNGMWTNRGRAGAAIAVLVLIGGLGLWAGRRIADTRPVVRETIEPAPVAQSAASASGGETDDPATELRRLRGPNARPAGVTPSRSFDLPRGRAVDVVAALQPRAEAGDAEAAMYLFIKIDECRRQLYRDGHQARPAPVRGDSVEAQLIARTPPDCHGLTLDQYQNNVRWLEQAADAGIAMAQRSYAGNAEAVVGNSSQMLAHPEKVVAYRRKAMQYLRQAAVNGSVEALIELGDAYDRGILAQRDPMRAYAYYYATDLVSPSAYGRQRLQTYAAHLEPSQLATATQQGRRIYEACCR